MAVVQGVEVSDIIIDAGESAKSLDRPGMARLRAMANSGEVQIVIIAKLDRLTRSVKDLAELLENFQKRGVSLVSVAESLDTGSAAGRLVLNIMVSVSQWEREAIGERTACALNHKKANRRAYNHTPYGFARNGDQLTAVPVEQDIISGARLESEGGRTYREIAARLNQAAVPTKQGGRWHASTVHEILRNGLHTNDA